MSLLHNTKRIFTMSIKSVFIFYIAILHLILFIGFRSEKITSAMMQIRSLFLLKNIYIAPLEANLVRTTLKVNRVCDGVI